MSYEQMCKLRCGGPPLSRIPHRLTLDYGWSRDETTKTLTPKTLPPDVAIAPPEILELLRCGCSTDQPCSTQRCGCLTGHLPCTFFCACRGESSCANRYNSDKEGEQDDGNQDFAELEDDLIVE